MTGVVAETDSDHRLAVTAWFQRAAQGHSVDSSIEAFDSTFAALWQRTHVVLGEVTLTAIVDRVLQLATEQFPFLGSLEVDATGLRCQSLRTQVGLRPEQVAAAIQFVLVEFLTVLGNLTAHILTPALHVELSKSHPSVAAGGATEDPAS